MLKAKRNELLRMQACAAHASAAELEASHPHPLPTRICTLLRPLRPRWLSTQRPRRPGGPTGGALAARGARRKGATAPRRGRGRGRRGGGDRGGDRRGDRRRRR
eukprot:3151719-Prymnesium_polylepis.1